MAKSSTSFNGNNKPSPRGRSNKTIIIEAMREAALLELTSKSTKDDAEKAFFKMVLQSAVQLDDPNRGMCIKLLADKGWASLKPSSECVEFDFDHEADVHVQAAQLVKAISVGSLAPDIGNTLIQSIRAMMGIEADTIIKERIEKIEVALNGVSQ